jgi:ParB family transcriptional regulator, chromosome partitioning protein
MGKRNTHNGGMNTAKQSGETVGVNIGALEIRHESLRVRQPRHEKNLLSSLSESGQQSPVIAVREAERLVVIDGHKRIRALKKLKADTVQVVVWEMTQADALACVYRMNSGGVRHAFEEGRLIETLHREFRWTLREIGKKMVKSKSWVSRRLSLVEEMPEWLTEAIVEGRIGVNAAVVYVGPLWRHNTSEAKALVEKIQALELSDRQMRELLMCYRTAKPEVKKKIVEDPALYLKARQAAQATAELSDTESRCVKNLTIVGNICVGLVKSLPEALPTESAGSARETIHKAWTDCNEKYRWLEKTAVTVLGAARVG